MSTALALTNFGENWFVAKTIELGDVWVMPLTWKKFLHWKSKRCNKYSKHGSWKTDILSTWIIMLSMQSVSWKNVEKERAVIALIIGFGKCSLYAHVCAYYNLLPPGQFSPFPPAMREKPTENEDVHSGWMHCCSCPTWINYRDCIFFVIATNWRKSELR